MNWKDDDCRGCAALTATLDKVRALDLDPERLRLDKRIPLETKRALADIVAALSTAGAPDAGQPCRCVGCSNGFTSYCEVLDGQRTPPEPKGPEHPSEWEIAKAFWLASGVETFELEQQGGYDNHGVMVKQTHADYAGDWVRAEDYRRDLAAAKLDAKLARASASSREGALRQTDVALAAANARADAAEREARQLETSYSEYSVQSETEIDQLGKQVAAHVSSLARSEDSRLQERRLRITVEMDRDRLGDDRDQLAARVERVAAIVSERIPPFGIPGPSQRLVLRVREELGIGWPL